MYVKVTKLGQHRFFLSELAHFSNKSYNFNFYKDYHTVEHSCNLMVMLGASEMSVPQKGPGDLSKLTHYSKSYLFLTFQDADTLIF